MRSHMKLHSDGIQICKVCGKVNPHRRALRSHMDIHKPPKHVCNVCGKGFHKLLQLRVRTALLFDGKLNKNLIVVYRII